MRLNVAKFEQWPKEHRDSRGFADTASLAAHFGVGSLGIETPWIGFVSRLGWDYLGVEDRTHAGRVLRSEFGGQVFRLGAYVLTDVRTAEEIRRQHVRNVHEAKKRDQITDTRALSSAHGAVEALVKP